MGFHVRGASAEPVVFTGLVELLTAEVALVEVEMAAMLQAEV